MLRINVILLYFFRSLWFKYTYAQQSNIPLFGRGHVGVFSLVEGQRKHSRFTR